QVVVERVVEGGVVLEIAVAEGELTGGPVGSAVVDDRAAEEDAAAADGQGRARRDGRGSGASHRPARPAEGLAGGDVDGAGAVEVASGEEPVDGVGGGVQRQGAVGDDHRPGNAQGDGCGDGRGASRNRKGPGPGDAAGGDVEGSAAEVQGTARWDRDRPGTRASDTELQCAGVDVDRAGGHVEDVVERDADDEDARGGVPGEGARCIVVEDVGAAAVGQGVVERGVEGGVVLEIAVAEGELTGGPVGGAVVGDRAAQGDAGADGQGRARRDGRGSGASHRPARPAEGLAGGDVDGAGAVEVASGEE